MNDYFTRVQKMTPTRFWINNVTHEQAELALAAGAVGCTQNPSYTWKILNGSADSEAARQLAVSIMCTELDDNEVLVKLQRELIGGIAKHFLPLYEQSKGRLGYVSIQGDPFQEDTESIIRFARYNREAGPNIMAKIPATPSGLEAIRVLAAEGVPINATECMAVRQVIDACEVYTEATKNLEHPAPMYFSLITGIFDEYLQKQVEREAIGVSADALHQAGLAVAKKVHEIVNDCRYPCGFIGGGARALYHFTDMVGSNASITINWAGSADELLRMNATVEDRFAQPVPALVLDELVEKLEVFRKAYFIHAISPEEYENFGPVVLFRSSFEQAWKNALGVIAELRKQN